MLNKLIELLKSDLCWFNNPLSNMNDGCVERLAERLISEGVTILPEGAIILTRKELDALNKHNEKVRAAIFADVEQLLEDRGKLEGERANGSNDAGEWRKFEYAHMVCASLLVDLRKIERRYAEQ